ncbi:helix-turn-helix transcriptional regulator [Nitratireductor sp. StC3]|uniref:helix-turn-helix transcriptional regulator n=1 Tax=Nitratireductor sp. StC3 TaxID=2126741 RepID=UPI000D0D64CB|nr:helix-turn-helix transcriptional regulator [Nitratireductor sp. StC3]PSM18845.1 LuxR family transcriptional regulator [Nitratireductor sp. StC3]
MNGARQTLSRETLAAIPAVTTRSDLSDCLGRICAEAGAERFLLLGTLIDHGGERPYIIASNWVYDTVHILGLERLARLSAGPRTCAIGEPAKPIATDGDDALHLLARHGHAEIYCVGLNATAQRCKALFSSGRVGAIDDQMLPQAQLACCYLLSRVPADLLGTPPPNSLSVRERECLRWVSEGKTTGEVAMILGVTANTVNSYLAHAIRKYGASNRAMAIATAIRSGTI